MIRAGLKPVGPIAPNWAPRPILQTLVQADWEPGPTEIVPPKAGPVCDVQEGVSLSRYTHTELTSLSLQDVNRSGGCVTE